MKPHCMQCGLEDMSGNTKVKIDSHSPKDTFLYVCKKLRNFSIIFSCGLLPRDHTHPPLQPRRSLRVRPLSAPAASSAALNFNVGQTVEDAANERGRRGAREGKKRKGKDAGGARGRKEGRAVLRALT